MLASDEFEDEKLTLVGTPPIVLAENAVTPPTCDEAVVGNRFKVQGLGTPGVGVGVLVAPGGGVGQASKVSHTKPVSVPGTEQADELSTRTRPHQVT